MLAVSLGVLAVATAIPAWLLPAWRQSQAGVVARSEAGVLGRAGVAPESIVGLRVVAWDETLAAARLFEVKRDGDRWIIPSHYGYPADGNTRVTRTAAGLLGVSKGRFVTDNPAEHEALGVIDPLEHSAEAKKGFGKRVTLTDQTGAVALDVIVGYRVEGGEGLFYVREVGSNAVHTAKIDGDISTRFVDYVETDPFKIQRDAVRAIAIIDYKLDPDRGTITLGQQTQVRRGGPDKDWESAQAPEGKRVNKTKIDDVLNELTYLRLQGVRPFNLRWLQTRGFYLGNDPQLFQLPNALTVHIQGKPYALFGTEGRTDVTTKDGLRYSFMYGKVALGDEQDKDEELKEGEGAPKADGSNRYLAVFVTYDPALDEESKVGEATPAASAGKKLTGKQRAERAQQRFQQFFYVISDYSFKRLRPDVSTWWEDKPAEPMAGNTGKTVRQWLADNAQLPGVTTTASGLQYQVLESGPAQAPTPALSDRVRVAYRGTLVDGTEFDASQDAEFAVSGVIKGWTEALQLMRPGDRWRLFIPPELGYGEAGSPPKIGPHQILIFEVQLKDIVGKPAPAPRHESTSAEPAP
ncbi:MAG: DUF4340 domain-containing protein [Planctomycetes bacterium]|nr:DUF4340 domain-containing protein [Planctomycetota bacterium]